MSTQVRAVSVHDYSLPDAAPAAASPALRIWVSRGANFAVVTTMARAGAVLVQPPAPDESMILLSGAGARIVAGAEEAAIDAASLVIAPPGPFAIHMAEDGLVIQIFSSRAAGVVEKAENAAAYRDGAPDCAALGPGAPPVGGYRLRTYRLADYPRSSENNHRIFRSENLMLNILERRDVARDVTALSPHAHADFEQGSLVLEGRYIHHARYPWTKNMEEWRADEHLEAGAPSLTVIPPQVIHTSRNIVGDSWMVDIFAPPREDFLRRPGAVRNAADYPPLS